MNTKKGIGIAMAVLIAAVAMAALATAYSGDHQLRVSQQQGMIDGGVIFVTDESGSLYTCLGTYYEPELSQGLEVDIPEGATVKSATLYNYYTWSRPGADKNQPGVPAQATLTLTDTITGETLTRTCMNPKPCTDLTECDSGKFCPCPNPIQYGKGVVQYWDIKDLTYGTTWRAPGGTFTWDVTDMVTGSGTYTATIENAKAVTVPSERFCTYGFGLLVVYENPNPGKPTSTYWIAEGHDILYASSYYGITPEMATTSALFHGNAHLDWIEDAELCIVSTAINKEKTTKPVVSPPPVLVDTSMVYFNGNALGPQEVRTVPPDWTLGSRSISVNCYDVTELVEANHNLVEIQDIKEYFEARNAFLKLDYGE